MSLIDLLQGDPKKELGFDPDELRAKYLAERDKRVRPDGNEQYTEVVNDFAHYNEDPYTERIERDPVNDEVQIVVVGGGFGGLLMAGRLKEAGFDDVRVIEKGGDFGGTWYWNRYPGAMCDVESYCYLPMLEELDYIPKHKYSLAPEIMAHSMAIAEHFDLYEKALLQTGVSDMRWDETDSRWIITTDRGDTMRCQYVAMANGPLNRPKLPGIPGIGDFGGHTFHTSRWDYEYTGGSYGSSTDLIDMPGLADKKVAIIGTGATAVQCIPHLGASAEHLYVFQRTPSSVDVRNNRETKREELGDLSPGWQDRRMENFNVLVSGGDQDEDLVSDGWTDIFRNLTGIAAKAASKELGRRLTSAEKGKLMVLSDYKKMNEVRGRVEDIVKDTATADALKPWYRQFCKRPCFHDDYLPTFNRPNVTLVDTGGLGVKRITETGMVIEEPDGNGGFTETEYEVDCIVFATGFEVGTSYTRRAGYDITGVGGRTISDHWADGWRTLHGLSSHGFPNCFFLGFTQTAVTVNVPHALNEQAKHVRYILENARDQGAEIVEATMEGEQGWCDEMESKARLGQKFYAECTPGYYNNEGKPNENPVGFRSGTYGAGPIKFFRVLDEWRSTGRLEGLDLR